MKLQPMRGRVRVIASFLFCGMCTSQVGSATPPLDERAVRAAYIYNLAKYVTWHGDQKELILCQVGDPLTGEIFQKLLAGKSTGERVVRVVLSPSEDKLSNCNVVYVDDADARKTNTILAKTHGRDVLTIGQSDAFTRAGGIASLVRSNDQIQIQINLGEARQDGIEISSHVLNIAKIVQSDRKGDN